MPEGQLLWTPSDPDASEMARFMRARGCSDYHSLWRWSVEDLDGFWAALWDWFEIEAGYESVLGRREMPGAEWFAGAELNYAEHLFRGAQAGETAIVHASESQPLSELTWDDLADQVARCAAGLRRLGVERGDRVAAYLPNVPETVVAFLACASIGAIWSSCAPEFGVPTVIDRFAQIEPKVLVAIEEYRYGGKDFDRRERVREHLKKSRLHTDLSAGDRFFWFTTTGWMMWNFLVGGLLAGSAIVLYDGQPDPERLWEFGAEAGVTTFGTSAGFIAASMKAGG